MKISKTKKDKISEQILALLFSKTPKPLFTSEIASEIARDEEFVKYLLSELKKSKLVLEITKNPQGKDYLRRARWTLTNPVYEAYKKHQNLQPTQPTNTIQNQ